MDDDDDFFDTKSVNSFSSFGRRRSSDIDKRLSRSTVYYSAWDMELDNLVSTPEKQKKNWRSFSQSDLSVDFVLAYTENDNSEHKRKREKFEANLQEQGLLLEKEENQKICFVKIHAPEEVLSRYAEVLKLRLPLKDPISDQEKPNMLDSMVSNILKILQVEVDENKFPKQKYKLTAPYARNKSYLFDTESPNFFSTSVRLIVVSYILEREKFDEENQNRGIKMLTSEGVYKAAYPLHDGDPKTPGSQRHLLLTEWAAVSKCMKLQPIDYIKEYFGVKFALYFTWLGFYTHMLIPAALIGLVCVIFGLATLDNDTISRDICNLNITMCPLCDKYCDYWQLSKTCIYAKVARVIDNPMTIVFAVFMSFWSALYLELWKRYSAEITHRWGLTGFDLEAEPPRTEYLTRLANAKKHKLNVTLQMNEPVVPFWRVKVPSIILSFTLAIFWICLALSVVVGIIIYRMSLVTSSALYADRLSYRVYVVPVTAGLINLVCIVILNLIYDKLAVWLTEMELQRSQTEYDNSLTLKIYMFQFVNYYSSIFYIAFLKGKFVGYPAKYNKVFGYRQEECNPGGCLMELTIQLAIIMIGNQAINSILELLIPFLMKLYNTFMIKTGLDTAGSDDAIVSCNQWTEDYKLTELGDTRLFTEYLEMVLQYGFVTIFVTAFPLAPLFALINNIFEMRLDAKKFIKYYRRPVPRRVKNIGVWFRIIDFLGRISIVSNAFIIAFSSNFIPKLVYLLKENKEHTEEGYLNFTLSFFDTRDFRVGAAPVNSSIDVAMCRYPDYRYPPWHEMRYKRPSVYWHILAARLAFVVVFQNLVSIVVAIVQSIPDMPRKLRDQIKREAYTVNETIIKEETQRARERSKKDNSRDFIHNERNGSLPGGNYDRGEPFGGVIQRNRNSVYHDISET
ncbi:anoctamin-1 isoform X2 [Agrilus planipennis]|uniref:Anoctamin n=1 Tax=Agrilus planipennis TaxID=224129 RepID=A0A1W4XAI7_AGRPL|nr:anoctamin-1 isoform X2 [Agrilus planipennis]